VRRAGASLWLVAVGRLPLAAQQPKLGGGRSFTYTQHGSPPFWPASGPIIVNEDCTMRRIENWNGLSQQERDAAWRRIAERNNRRLAVCRELHEAEEGPMGIDELEADDEERSMEVNHDEL
jgi:hypothetical protein